jgi:DUF4097 and DUF4098 domain-containing protein YvlB
MRYQRTGLWVGLAVLTVFGPGCERWLNGLVGDRFVDLTRVSSEEAAPSGTSRLAVKNSIGDVTVLAEAIEVIRIEAEVRIKESRATETEPGTFADHVEISVADGTVTIADAHLDQPDKDDWSIAMVIRMPEGLAVKVDNGVGDVQVEGTRSELMLATGVGDVTVEAPGAKELVVTTGVGNVEIEVEKSAGKVKAQTGTGNVALAVTSAPPTRKVKLSTGVGDIRLKIPPDASGSFTCETGVGSVRVTGHEGISTSKSGASAKAKGTIGQGEPVYELEAGVGNVVIE